jgi:hypothetical protein
MTYSRHVMGLLPPGAERWGWSATAEIVSDGDAGTHLTHLVDNAAAFPFTAYVEGSADGNRVVVRLLLDAPDFAGALGRTLEFLSKEWTEPAERVVAMELRRA